MATVVSPSLLGFPVGGSWYHPGQRCSGGGTWRSCPSHGSRQLSFPLSIDTLPFVQLNGSRVAKDEKAALRWLERYSGPLGSA